jgi:hypothetical protein
VIILRNPTPLGVLMLTVLGVCVGGWLGIIVAVLWAVVGFICVGVYIQSWRPGRSQEAKVTDAPFFPGASRGSIASHANHRTSRTFFGAAYNGRIVAFARAGEAT